MNHTNLFGVLVASIDHNDLLFEIEENMNNDKSVTISYVTANSLNLVYFKDELVSLFNSFDIIHPDGIGAFLASKYLYGKNGLKNRFTGSDFYPKLLNLAKGKGWKLFFFGGDAKTTLLIHEKLKSIINVETISGFDFNNDIVLQKINAFNPDVLFVGLGCPLQEKWIQQNKKLLNVKTILAVGEGLKIFAGNKKRGPKIMRILGFEWFIRLVTEPKKMWKRYLIGIPLFIFRVIKYKVSLRNSL